MGWLAIQISSGSYPLFEFETFSNLIFEFKQGNHLITKFKFENFKSKFKI